MPPPRRRQVAPRSSLRTMAERAVEVLPGGAVVTAADDAALFDADEDLVRHPGVERDPAGVGDVGRNREAPALVVGQIAESGQLLEGATAVLAAIHDGRHRAQVDLVRARRMDRHRPDLAVIHAAGWLPLPGLA